ncbi:tryptophan synthase subunit alpha [Niveibacterium terrae]|uniref:tryptophan synthase subunit alpha n=1 Tax=Niveibacterium terrae TaxID=3373598 RepID=UPI003A926A72
MKRLSDSFTRLESEGRSGLACYFTAGDPDFSSCLALLRGLCAAGADLIELGLPFSDPVADGEVIQAAHRRALASGQTVARTLRLVQALRETDATTPVVLMGYLNPVFQYGESFFAEAAAAGADGLILVDLPPEHAEPWSRAADAAGLALIRMSAPTSSDERLMTILPGAKGFLYHVSLNGTTGAASCAPEEVGKALARIRAQSPQPIAVGFGIRSAEQVKALNGVAEIIVVGSHLVAKLAKEGNAAALAEVRLLAAPLRASSRLAKNEGAR